MTVFLLLLQIPPKLSPPVYHVKLKFEGKLSESLRGSTQPEFYTAEDGTLRCCFSLPHGGWAFYPASQGYTVEWTRLD